MRATATSLHPWRRKLNVHPILPTLVVVLIGMADWGAFYLWRYGKLPEVSMHSPSIWVLIGISLFFGNGLAFWMRRFRWNFPFILALASTLLIIASAFLRF